MPERAQYIRSLHSSEGSQENAKGQDHFRHNKRINEESYWLVPLGQIHMGRLEPSFGHKSVVR